MQTTYRRFGHERWLGWTLVLIFCTVPVIRWLMLPGLEIRFDSFNDSLLSLGRLTGLVGLVLYAVNLVLSIRKPWLEHLFGGLNVVYKAHHITGGLALILLLFHPFFLAIRYIELTSLASIRAAAEFLLPRNMLVSDIYDLQEAVAINNGIIAFIGLVVLLFITFFTKLPYRIWLFTHKFLGVAFVFAGLHTIFVASDVYNDTFLKIYFIVWTAIGLLAYIYRSLLGNIVVRRSKYQVFFAGELPGNVIHIYLTPLGKALPYKAGQFIFIRFIGAKQSAIKPEIHPFSIASSPTEPNGQIRLYVKALGDFTSSLKYLQPGTVAEIEGAFGRFVPALLARNRPQVWIAGGIGITPFISAARSYTDQDAPVDLYYSVQSRHELLDQEALAAYLPVAHKNFRFIPFVFEEQQTFLSADYIAQISGDLTEKEILLCGPPPMMKSMRAQLVKMGVPNGRIHSEEFSIS